MSYLPTKKQDTLVSGTNIKTINSNSILGSGDLEVTGSSSDTIVIAGSDTTNSTTSLADATGLTFSASANSSYLIEVFLRWDASATAVGIQVSATASGSPTLTAGLFLANAAAGTADGSVWNADDVVTTTTASAFTAGNVGVISALLITSGSSSTWQVRFAAEATGSITVKAGSIIRYRKVA